MEPEFVVTECKNCKKRFETYSEGLDRPVFFAWFDVNKSNPICSMECVSEYEEKNSWEYEENYESLEVDQLKKEMKLFNEG